MALEFFLTAYDPSDLPGGSIDPLGFDRGYGFLADKILPGLTNVAGAPRYFGLLCAGSFLANLEAGDPLVRLFRKREEAILRLERCWALANVLASEEQGSKHLSGLRGVTYARAHVERIQQSSANNTDLNFRLLLRQTRYGVMGIYGRVAEEVELLSRKTLKLKGLGEQLAMAFLDETDVPASIKRVVNDRDFRIPISDLRDWGQRAHLWKTSGKREAECIWEMLNL